MTATEYREWAAQRTTTAGSAEAVDCESIAEAEGYVTDYPADGRGFATAGRVAVEWTTPEETRERMRSMLRDAGYAYSREDGQYERPGYTAQATYHDGHRVARIYVYRAGEWQAWDSGPDGHLPPDSRPQV